MATPSTAQRLTPAQIAGYARGAGLTGPAVAIAVAIALAESGGNPRATHQNTDRHRSIDYGLWQINGFWHREYDTVQLLDPAYNARAMAAISKGGTDWGAWTTYSSGRWREYQAEATAGASSSTTDARGIQMPSLPSAGDVVDAVTPFDDWAKGWARQALALVLVGVLVSGGLAIVAIGLGKLSGLTPTDAVAGLNGPAGIAATAATLA